MGNTLTKSDAPVDSGDVIKAQNAINDQINHVENNFLLLVGRLKPVTGSPPVADEKPGTPISNCKLADELYYSSSRLQVLNEAIIYQLNNLEL